MYTLFRDQSVLYVCRDHFYQFGEIQHIQLISKQHCAFMTYSTRGAAEKAADTSFNKLIIKGILHCYGHY